MPVNATSPLQHIGNYDIIAKLAEGGMGSVYKGRHRQTGLIVAIKVVPNDTARNPVLMKRFEQEFNAASRLDHPNVVKALEYNGSAPNPFLVMEFVEGESLGQRVERRGPFAEQEALQIMAQVCQGLYKAHKAGIIHRDVKPDNIMLTPEGTAKLTDLGLVKVQDAEAEMNLTRTGRGLGTPHFMAPEQFRNAKNADVRCDIYSLGATLYMLLTGKMPFSDAQGPLEAFMKKMKNDLPSPRSLNPNITTRVDWAIRRAMSGDPSRRPNSCREFMEDLTGKSLKASDVPAADLWYLVYKDELGIMHTVKGATDGIRRNLAEGTLGNPADIRAALSKQGPFQPIEAFPEFRDLLIDPAPMPPASSSSKIPTTNAQAKVAPPSPAFDPDAVDFVSMPVDNNSSSSQAKLRGPASGRFIPGPPSQPANPSPESGGFALPEGLLKPLPTSGTQIPIVTFSPQSNFTKPSNDSVGHEWMMWVGVLIVALVTSFVAFLYFPMK